MAEWYQPALTDDTFGPFAGQLVEAARTHSNEHPVRLLVTVAALADEMLYSIFEAQSADTVSQVCRRAGWPADRITAVRARADFAERHARLQPGC
ncbi:hypothetical protein H7I41_04845 [Mycobacterium manitobense]|uniref:Uncharacterized protein n=1 Tax=[Mycobacterium] manitobense TaxID=190147 RepID=A0A9X2Y7A8_9MYCO|nr:DUF4242 domain-containing protein [[Mycobacterium] manitobense]MCV7169252.1 hypothetical protein [[Mycobacterium] manitobense]